MSFMLILSQLEKEDDRQRVGISQPLLSRQQSEWSDGLGPEFEFSVHIPEADRKSSTESLVCGIQATLVTRCFRWATGR